MTVSKRDFQHNRWKSFFSATDGIRNGTVNGTRIHHSERQKSHRDSVLIDTIDNLHTPITKCFVNRYGTRLFVMCVCKPLQSAHPIPPRKRKPRCRKAKK